MLTSPKKAGDTEAWLQAERVHEEENQGKNGQGGSAANFLPAPRKAGDPHAEAWLAWLQAGRDRKEDAHAAAQRKTNHLATQGGGTCSPQVSTVLFGSKNGKISGGNQTARKRCQFFTGPQEERKCCRFSPGHGYPVQKRGRYSPGCPWAEAQVVIGGVDQG
jgi:hypothetical protein